MFLKSKNKNPSAADLEDFGLFKKTAKASASGEEKPKAKPIKSEDIIDIESVDVVKTSEAVEDPIEASPSSKNEDADDAFDTPSVNADSGPALSSSPFEKKSKPSISIKQPKKEGPKPIAPEKKSFFTAFLGKSKESTKKQVNSDSKNAPPPMANKLKEPKTEGGAKPFNLLSFMLVAVLAGAAGAGLYLQDKNKSLSVSVDKLETSVSAATEDVNAKLKKIAVALDQEASINVVNVLIKAKLLELPDSTLKFRANAKDSAYELSYKLQESATAYDFSKFNKSDFPAFSTGAFGACDSSNNTLKQGDKDVFVLSIKC